MKKKILLISALTAGITVVYGQRWEPASQKSSQIRKEVEVQHAYRVDLQSLRNLLKDAVETGKDARPVIVSLPTAEGKIEKFAVYSNPVMEKSLVDQYQLGSYVGVGIDDPTKYLRFSTAPTEMQSMIIKDGKFQFIEAISTDKQTYGVFYKTKEEGEHGFKCGTEEHDLKDINRLVENGKKQLSGIGITKRPTNTKYRDFRLALSVTGEYTQFHGGTLAGALTAMNNTITRVNGIFERDFGAHFTIQDFPTIIYMDAATDPYTNNLNLQLQQTLTSLVGNANYDIGHVFNAAGDNGNAGGIGIVCVNPTGNTNLAKGSAFSQKAQPIGDGFDLVVAHEMGHQLGANHTLSSWSESSGANVEPGGGTTLMSYPGGRTGDPVQADFDANFHYKSISQVLSNLESKLTCGNVIDINNNTAPVISPAPAHSIPKGTAYYLETTAVDAENDPITYSWEQYDSVGALNSISGDSGWGYNQEGGLARSYPGTVSGRRYFPKLETVINGVLTNKTGWETVSYIPRELHYAITAKDQNVQRPMLSTSETIVTVGNEGPFKFNGLTVSSILYNNALNNIQWEVANTNNTPYNVANVKIDYTTDNGATWVDLIASTPNTGSYAVQMPSNINGTIKLRIAAIGNIFYAISPAVTIGAAPTSTSDAPTGVSTIPTEVFKTTARVSWNNVPGATYSINYRTLTASNWSNTTSQTNSVVLTGLEDETSYEVQVAALVNTVPGAFSNNYTFKTNGLKTGIDYCILNSGTPRYGMVYRVSLNGTAVHTDGTYRAYKDLSEDPTKTLNLVKGIQYSLDLRTVISPAYADMSTRPIRINAWIDYNRNGLFEDSERIYGLGANNVAVNTSIGGSVNFTVPATAYSGTKTLRMRVVSKYGNSDLVNTCGEIPEGGGGIMDLPVKITDNTVLAVNEIKDTKSEISIYPNPADTFIEVKNLKGKADYKIYSADGRLVQEGKIDRQKINVASLLKGMYVVTIKDDTNTYNTKLIKK